MENLFDTIAIIKGECCIKSSGKKLEEFTEKEEFDSTVSELQQSITESETRLLNTLQEEINAANTHINEVQEQLQDDIIAGDSYNQLVMLILMTGNNTQCSTTSQIDCPEYKYVVIDAEEKILCGINAKYQPIFYATSREIMDCINASYQEPEVESNNEEE